MGLNSYSRTVSVGIALAILLAIALVPTSIGAAYAASSASLTVNAYSLDGKTTLNMSITIQKQDGTIVKSGLTPLAFSGTPNKTYIVVASDNAVTNIYFDHWNNGSTSKSTTVTLKGSTTLSAYYKTSATGPTTHNLTVNAVAASDSSSLAMPATVISAAGTVVRTGSTPLTYTGTADATYMVAVSNGGGYTFDHWQDGSTANPRTVALSMDVAITAYYKASPTTIQSLIPKTGILVSLYMYPGSTGATYWQQVIDQKQQHPSVPIVAVFNPSSGPGTSRDSNIASWVAKLQSAGVIAIGYTSDNYAARSLASLEADANIYKNWYNADGLFIDEFTNKVGYETHYRDLTTYAKSLGMKMTLGNPGTDVPQSYVGTVDVINITEGSGYMPISWLQYCVNCTADQGWHYQYDKRNFSYVRYGITSLDSTFEVDSSQWVGLLYLTSGTTADGRWFYLPSYYGTEVAVLDR